ncbi:MAG TPA: c-type cytochrome [Candidatus Accumulibacter phosphatis]|nr:MAG: Cytochrome c555 [Candidatus Accumulibacter sp. SK-11]HAY28882.1 cytochrome c5 family protein [Accumulibacter sp.]HCN69694.1 cytochrome c5 family protein [Accumulibacter sp.]HRL75279.1 c-type cytochrome [Candidatus Accumulibacter phosphatis]HRQ94056.1 c-type cytochrome [Candidatus Accumulibacter phosphatis]
MAQQQSSSRLILVVTIVVAIVLIVVIWPLSLIGKGQVMPRSADDPDARIQPVAKVELAKAAAKSDGKPRDGATVYQSVCMACHASGAAGAPKAGDKAAWAPRIATGTAAMITSVTNGKGAMPPKGGGADLTEGEIKAAVEHLVGLAK